VRPVLIIALDMERKIKIRVDEQHVHHSKSFLEMVLVNPALTMKVFWETNYHVQDKLAHLDIGYFVMETVNRALTVTLQVKLD